MTAKAHLPPDLHLQACEARINAYAPYSGYQIGAAVVLANGEVHTGGNIENASFGGTVCAERVAIWKAVSHNPGVKIKDVLVVSDASQPWPPCGLCRQVIAEFADQDTRVHVGDLKEIRRTYKFDEIFPEAFTPGYLRK